MSIPCVGCISLPICVGMNLFDLNRKCEDMNTFISKKKVWTKMIREEDSYKTVLRLYKRRPQIHAECLYE